MNANYIRRKLLKSDRELDGFSESILCILVFLKNKKDISDFHERIFLQAKNNVGGCWFDKTPQK